MKTPTARCKEPRKVHLRDQVPVLHKALRASVGGVGEVHPERKPGKDEHGIRDTFTGDLRKAPEHDRENRHSSEGLQNGPRDAEQGLLVADLDVSERQDDDELSRSPQLRQIDARKPAAGRSVLRPCGLGS
jgi:hypothetical protein